MGCAFQNAPQTLSSEINAKYANQWPNIRKLKPAPADADEWLNVPNKFEDHFNPNPPKDS